MRKLVTAAVGYTAALVLSHYLLPAIYLPYFAVAFAAFSLTGFFLKGKLRRAVVIFCLMAAVGFAWTMGHYALFVSPVEKLVGQSITANVRVIDYAEVNDDYSRIEVRLSQDGLPSARLYAYDYNCGFGELEPGDIVTMQIKLTDAGKINGVKTDMFFSDGIYAKASLTGTYTTVGRWSLSFLYFPKSIGLAIKQQALKCFLGDVAPLMKALLTGDKAELYGDVELYSALKTSGFIHIIAVSGMHVAFLLSMLRLGTGRRRLTAFIGIPLIVVFMAMVGFPPSVVRSGIMMIIMLLAPLLGRENDPPTSLAAALLVLLLINPQAVANIGLQLSFAAMAGILLVSPRVYAWSKEKLKGVKSAFARKLLNGISNSFSSSVGAIIFTTPLTALYFGYVPLYSILTNLLCLWAMSTAFMLGYLVCLAGLISAFLGGALGWCISWLPRYAVFVIKHIAALPMAAVYTTGNYGAWWLILVYITFFAAYMTKGKESFRPVLPLCISVFSLALISLFQYSESPERLSVTALDVGQGQCIAALTGRGTVLIDCGGMSSLENAGETAEKFLRENGRNSVDLLIMTHFHDDHANGVVRLMETMEVKRIALTGSAEKTEYYDDILALALEQRTELYYIEHDSDMTVDDLEMTVYAPFGAGEENESGLMVLGKSGEFEFLVTGDAGADTERLLCACCDLPDIELLVAGHHGSKNSTCDELLDETTPETAFISVGYNIYGHPTQETLDRLGSRSITVYRTDIGGNITLTVGMDDGEEG